MRAPKATVLNIWVADGQQDESKLSRQYVTLIKTKAQTGYSNAGNEISAWLKSGGDLPLASATLGLLSLLWVTSMAVTPTSLRVNAWDPNELGVPRSGKSDPCSRGSGSKTRTSREIHGGVAEQREVTRKCFSELLADVLDMVFKQHQSYSKEKLRGKSWGEDDEIPHRGVQKVSLKRVRWIHLTRHYSSKQKIIFHHHAIWISFSTTDLNI